MLLLRERPRQVDYQDIRPYQYVAKTGGTTGSNFDAWDNGVIGDIARGDFPAPRILLPSAPGVILEHLRTRGAQFVQRAGEVVSVGGIIIPSRISFPELTDREVVQSNKLTHHAAWAMEARQRGDSVELDRHFEKIDQRFLGIVRDANLNNRTVRKYEKLLENYYQKLKKGTAREGHLEIIQAQMVTDYLNAYGRRAVYLHPIPILETDDYGRVLWEQTIANMRAYLHDADNPWDRNMTIVFPSHSGVTKDGQVRDLTRNCGDTVATTMARAAKMPIIIFGSTDGVKSIDPEKYPGANPRDRRQLKFREMHTAAGSGASIVHVEAVRPVEQMRQGQMELRNFQSPHVPRTVVLRERGDYELGEAPRLIAGEVGNATVVFEKRSAYADHEFVPRVAEALRRRGMSVQRIVTDDNSQRVVAIINTHEEINDRERKAMKQETGAESTKPGSGRGMITIVGEGFNMHPSAERKRGEIIEELGITPRHSESTGRGSAWRYYVHPIDFESTMETLHRKLIEEAEGC